MAKLFLIKSDDIDTLFVSNGPEGKAISAKYDPEVETKITRVKDERPAGTIIGAKFAGETPNIVMFRDDDPETAKRLASTMRRTFGEYVTSHNLKAADLREFAERDDTIFLVTVGKPDEKTTGAYYRLSDPERPLGCKVLDANGNPAEPGSYIRKDDKPIISSACEFEIGEDGNIITIIGDSRSVTDTPDRPN